MKTIHKSVLLCPGDWMEILPCFAQRCRQNAEKMCPTKVSRTVHTHHERLLEWILSSSITQIEQLTQPTTCGSNSDKVTLNFQMHCTAVPTDKNGELYAVLGTEMRNEELTRRIDQKVRKDNLRR